MGYKTKSMINAKGAYAGGDEDPMYDSAAYLKTNLTDAGKSFGKLAGAFATKNKKGKETSAPEPITNATFNVKDRKGINTPTESNPVIDAIMKRTQPFSSLNTSEDADFKPKDGYSQAKNIFKNLNGGTEFSKSPIEMKGDAFNKGMLRKNKYKK